MSGYDIKRLVKAEWKEEEENLQKDFFKSNLNQYFCEMERNRSGDFFRKTIISMFQNEPFSFQSVQIKK